MTNSSVDVQYLALLTNILKNGHDVITRGHECKRLIMPPPLEIKWWNSSLLSCRKVAWKTALREYEWFLSGNNQLPNDATLQQWWRDQLIDSGDGTLTYPHGYADMWSKQLDYLVDGLKSSPFGRRHCVTLWDAEGTQEIPKLNPKMPTPCHGSFLQFFVVEEVNGRTLHMYHYQRSADVMLGLPHNLVQYKALLEWLSWKTKYMTGNITYQLGDAHIYKEHIAYATKLRKLTNAPTTPQLIYNVLDAKETFEASGFFITAKYEPAFTDSLPLIV